MPTRVYSEFNNGQCTVCAMENAILICENCGANWCSCCGSGGDCWCIDEVEVK